MDDHHVRLFFHLAIIFLLDYVKAEVYKHRPTTIVVLKAAVRQTANEIPQEMTRKVMENFRNRLQQGIAARGRHLEVVFKTKFTQNGNHIAL